MTITTSVGKVVIRAAYGQDPETGRWMSPIRELWGLGPHEKMSPVLAEKICYTATMTNSYEKASRVAAKWGSAVDDSVIHHHVQKAGGRAIALEEEREERALSVETRAEVAAEAGRDLPRGGFSLVIEMDGTMVRERGPDWGLRPVQTEANRVEWHELKGAIIYRLGDRASTQSGRRIILEKYYVACRAGPYEFGRKVYAEALRRGLSQARRVYVIADGAAWIWKIVEDRFPEAVGGLDFYHASEHLWAIAHERFGEDKLRMLRAVIQFSKQDVFKAHPPAGHLQRQIDFGIGASYPALHDSSASLSRRTSAGQASIASTAATPQSDRK